MGRSWASSLDAPAVHLQRGGPRRRPKPAGWRKNSSCDRRSSSDAIWWAGSTSPMAPVAIAARGMPSTCASAGACAKVMPPARVDSANPDRSVVAAAREDHADGPLLVMMGQRHEEVIDRAVGALPAWARLHVQVAVDDGHVGVGTDDV